MADTPKRAALYLRVSGRAPSNGVQIIELAHIAARAGWERAAIYRDRGIAGAKCGSEHPEFDRMLKDAARRQFDVLMAWSVDRLGHNLQDLAPTFTTLQQAGIDLYLKEQGVDTTTPSGKALFEMAGIFAAFERAMIRARVQAGIDRAREAGRLGRPHIDPAVADAIQAGLASGLSIRKAAKLHGVGISTVQRLKKAGARAADSLDTIPMPPTHPQPLGGLKRGDWPEAPRPPKNL
jgi:DNA invertase Pin-like site-specific DNA recombinase